MERLLYTIQQKGFCIFDVIHESENLRIIEFISTAA